VIGAAVILVVIKGIAMFINFLIVKSAELEAIKQAALAS
jgi:hypothetical protein